MSATASYSCLIRVEEEHHTDEEDEFWTLTSEDLPGFLLGGRDIESLRADIPVAIRAIFKHNYDMEVNVLRVTEPQNIAQNIPEADLAPPKAWTAIPLAA